VTVKDFIRDTTLYNEDNDWPLGVSKIVDKIKEEIKHSFPDFFKPERKAMKRKFLGIFFLVYYLYLLFHYIHFKIK
jgi:hypothetical protein